MKFLIDNNLSPLVAKGLSEAGYETSHVTDYALHQAPDTDLLALAIEESRIIISQDTDFGELLAKSGQSEPSVILIRWSQLRRAADHLQVILANLPKLEIALEEPCLIIIEASEIRIRKLPIQKGKG